MATSIWKRYAPVLASFLAVAVLAGIIVFFSLNPVPQTQLHLGCTNDSPKMSLIAPAVVYSDSYKWSTLVGPTSEMGTLPAGAVVCLVAHDDWNPRYALVVYPDPEGTGKEDEYVRGWVELETLPLEARHVRLSINDPWESSTYP